MISFFHTIIYLPLYNGLVLLLSVLPGADVGLAVILFTILIKSLLYPLAHRGLHTQRRMKEVEPRLAELKERHKDDRQELARKTMELYKEEKINPFASLLLLIIQLPVLICLYLVFMKGGLPNIDPKALYSFVTAPTKVSMHLFWVIDLSQKSLVLAGLTGITQYIRALVAPLPITPKAGAKPSFQEDFARSMSLQMRYVLPVIFTFIAYAAGGALALYWITSNLFDIATELLVTKKMKEKKI